MTQPPAARHPRRVALYAAVVLAGLLSGASRLSAQPALATAPASAPATQGDAEGGAVVVTSVEGKARARTDAGAEWKKVEVGMRLPQGAQIQTGPGSRVVCSIPPGREFIVDRLSTVTVLEADLRGNRATTDLLMEYGRTDLRVEKVGLDQDARVRTPGATASVRGTELSVYNQPPFAPELKTYTGVVDYRFAKRQLTVSRGGRSSGGRSTAETALLASVIDPNIANARTNADAALITQEVSRGAVVNFNPDIQLAEIRGGAGPQTDAQLFNTLPGRLNFVLRWSQNVDVDIFVAVDPRPLETVLFGPNGANFNPDTILFPGFGLQTAQNGGRVPFNHRGGPRGGQEFVFWPSSFPQGVFGFSALNNSTTTPVDVKFNTFLDGQKVPMYALDPELGLVRSNGFVKTVQPVNPDPNVPNSESVIVPVPRSDLFETIITELPDQTDDGTRGQGAKGAGGKLQTSSRKQASARSAQSGPTRNLRPDRPARDSRPTAVAHPQRNR